MDKMNKTSKTTIGAMAVALSVIAMLLTVVPVMTYASPMIAGMLLIVIAIELDKKWGFAVFAAVSVLSVLLASDKQAVILYIMFFGHYPLTKALIEGKIKSRLIEWLIKFAVFNAAMIFSYFLVVKVFAFPMDEVGDMGKYGTIILLILGNIFFPIYDIMLSRMVTLYVIRLRKVLRKIFK